MTVEHVAVIGAGTMGAGIAQTAAASGCRVMLIDVTDEAVQRGIDGMRKALDRRVERGKMSAVDRDGLLRRIEGRTVIEGLGETQLAIEAVVEDMGVKHKVFEQLAKACPADAVLATNTSSLRVSEIASSVADSSRVVGMHFFNPAPVMPLVEVIAGKASSERALDLVTDAANAWGKVPVRASDTPGFIVNRVARGFYLESLRMLGEGVADVATIDSAMKSLGTFRMGPFELMDLVGMDVNYAVSCSVYEQSGEPARLTPHEIQRGLVESGHLGRKTKRGFYAYDGESPTVAVTKDVRGVSMSDGLAEAVRAFSDGAALCDADVLGAASEVDRYVFSRVLAAIMNEAGLALGDRVATAGDIDIAMQRGTNYPKGPLAWAAAVGHDRVAGLLDALNATVDDGRFAAAAVLRA